MADLRKGLQKKRATKNKYEDIMASGPEDYGYKPADRSGLKSEYEDYKMDSDALSAEERKESRGVKKRSRVLSAIGKAASAIGKIGAASAGGLIKGDILPDMDYGQGELDEIGDKYDTKRLSLSKAGRDLRSREEELDVSDRASKAEAIAARKAAIAETRKEQAAQAEEKALGALEAKDKKEAFTYKSKARKDVTKMTDKLIEGIEDEDMQGEDVMEALENEGIPPEMLAPFKETLGFMEDEEAQVKTLEELKGKLIMHTVKKRIMQDIEDGKTVNPRILDALGLTEEAKSDTIKEPKPTKAAAGESKAEEKFVYELKLPSGKVRKLRLTPQEANDMHEKAGDNNLPLTRVK